MSAYQPLPISKRITKVREQYLTLPVPQEDDPYLDRKYKQFCTGDRWITLAFLEGYLKHYKAPTSRLRRAYAEAEEMYAAQPIILDDELLVGQLYLPEYTEEESFCYALRNQIGILVDGTVVPCCLDHAGEINLGNLFHTPLQEILSSPRSQAIYEGFSRHTAVEPLCRRCGYAAVTKRFRK